MNLCAPPLSSPWRRPPDASTWLLSVVVLVLLATGSARATAPRAPAPLSYQGVLLAFVVDGRFMAAMRFIAEYVTRDHPDHLLSGFEPTGWPPRRHLFETQHRRSRGDQKIRLLHLFLPFPRCL